MFIPYESQYEYTDLREGFNEEFKVFFDNEWDDVAMDFYHMQLKDPFALLFEDDDFKKYAEDMFFESKDRDPLEIRS